MASRQNLSTLAFSLKPQIFEYLLGYCPGVGLHLQGSQIIPSQIACIRYAPLFCTLFALKLGITGEYLCHISMPLSAILMMKYSMN